MTGQSWLAHTRRAMVLVTALLLTAAAAFGQGTLRDYRGLRLADALRALQGAGLRIVFTSRTVTPELRVASEPRVESKATARRTARTTRPQGRGRARWDPAGRARGSCIERRRGRRRRNEGPAQVG
jgi:hypothetical protein